MRQFRRTHFAAFLVVVGIYIASRFWGLTSSCLWFDELFSVHAAEHDWSSIWSFISLDLIHPPLFYIILKVWILTSGESLLWLRLLPVLFGVIAIFPFIYLCNELKISFWTRLLAFLLVAVNGSLIKYSQEVRMYSLLMCLSLFSMWLFTRYFQKGKGIVAFTIINILLVWTHYFGWFVVVSEVVAILIFQRIKWRAVILMFGVALASFVPWIISVAIAAREGPGLSQNIGWMTRPGVAAVLQLKLALLEPFYFQASNADPVSIYRISVPLLLLAAAGLILFLLGWAKHPSEEKRAFEIAAIFAGLPLLAAFVVSWLFPYSVWGTRHLIIAFAPASILIALSLSGIPVSNLRVAAVTIVVLFTGYAFVLQAQRPAPQYIWCAWEQLLERIEPGTEAHIYATEDVIAYHLWFAARKNPRVRISKREAGIPEDPAYFLPRGFNGVDRLGLAESNESEFWIAYRSSDGTMPAAVVQKGYAVVEEQDIAVQNTHAVLVRLRKE